MENNLTGLIFQSLLLAYGEIPKDIKISKLKKMDISEMKMFFSFEIFFARKHLILSERVHLLLNELSRALNN